ncbi:MAG: 50S ribosomal protein L9 [Actinobacteria bacterium]|nr:MAG: 50S ribosomal protein L9 [Actinomycetota bacterium]
MKVILLQEVKGKGSEGDVVEVARGYAVNYLFPKKMAVEATSGALKQLEARRHNIEKREAARRTDAESMAASVGGKTVTVEAKAGDEGKLFGSVTAQMVAEAIEAQLGVEVDRRKVDAHGHIKTLGAHPVTVQLHKDVKVELVVEVVPEGGVVEGAGAPAPVVSEPIAAEDVATEEPADADESAAVEEPAEEAVATEDADDAVADAHSTEDTETQ